MEDYIIRATAADGSIRAFAASTKNMVEEARKTHGLMPVATAALGRTLTATAIMSTFLKGAKDTLTVQIKGDGPLGGLVTVADSSANVRGYVYNPEAEATLLHAGKLNVGAALGKHGHLNVIKDMGLKEPYIGFVNLVSGEIAEDLTYYFANSEQIPSVVALGVLIDTQGQVMEAGGYIIQLMPDASDAAIDYLETRLGELPTVSVMLADGLTPEDILGNLLGGLGVSFLQTIPCKYKCNCSRDKMEKNLIALGENEIQDILSEQGEAELQCHFCNTYYKFEGEELKNILKTMEM